MTELYLPETMRASQLENFAEIFKAEVQNLHVDDLPIQLATTQGGLVDNDDVKWMVLTLSETDDQVQVRTGVFFSEVVGGCSCGDDPYRSTGYCEMLVVIDKRNGAAKFQLLQE